MNRIGNLLVLLMLTFVTVGQAQEMLMEVAPQQDTLKETPPFKRMKLDGIIATVGDHIILDSDIDIAMIEFEQEGNDMSRYSRCEILGMLMEDKLYAHHAALDSTIVVRDAEVRAELDEKLGALVEQLGSMDKVVRYYNKKNEEDLRTTFFDVLKMNKLIMNMKNNIVEEVEITPEEVRTFFKRIDKDELPVFGAEVEVAQIVIQPKISDEEKKKAIDKLNQIRDEVLAGASFTSRAVIYSDDRGSASNGGFYRVNRKTPFVKEFKDIAFSMSEGEISKPFETEFGFHIIFLEKIKGQELELRHILLMPKVSDKDLKEAREKAELIRKRIIDGEISFTEAAKTLSDEKETRNNGGALLNPKTLDTRFELTRMDPTLYNQVSRLKTDEISQVILEDDPRQGKRYKIMTVTNRLDEHVADYTIDYLKIKEMAHNEKRLKEVGKWFDENIKETYIRINGEYRECQFTNNWLKL